MEHEERKNNINPFYSEENVDKLKEILVDLDSGKNMTEHELIEVDDK